MRTLMRDMLQMLYWALIWRMCSNTRRLPKKNGVCGMLFYPPWSWWSVWSTNGWGIPWFLDLWFGDWWVNIPTPVGHRRSMSNPQVLNWSNQVFTEGLENSNCVGNLCQVFLPLAPIFFFHIYSCSLWSVSQSTPWWTSKWRAIVDVHPLVRFWHGKKHRFWPIAISSHTCSHGTSCPQKSTLRCGSAICTDSRLLLFLPMGTPLLTCWKDHILPWGLGALGERKDTGSDTG